MSRSSETWGFIGTGAITEAIVTGMIAAGQMPARLLVSRRNVHVSGRLAAMHPAIEIRDDNQQILDDSCLVFLAVRPQIAEDVLNPLRFSADHEVASLIATLPVSRVAQLIAPAHQITRAVPVPPVARCQGLTLMSGPSPRLQPLFEALGGAVVAQDAREFDAFTLPSTVMGLFFGLQDSLARGIVAQGGTEEGARRFITSMFRNLAETAASGSTPLDVLAAEHSTPGGLNQLLHETFTDQGGKAAVEAGLDQVANRIRAARSTQQG